jgi:hypothetical protein
MACFFNMIFKGLFPQEFDSASALQLLSPGGACWDALVPRVIPEKCRRAPVLVARIGIHRSNRLVAAVTVLRWLRKVHFKRYNLNYEVSLPKPF